MDAIYHILVNKRSNIQFGVSVHVSYDCPLLASPSALGLFNDTCLALALVLVLAGLTTEGENIKQPRARD